MKRIVLAMLASVSLATVAQAHPLHHRHDEGFFGGRPSNCRGIAWCGCWLRDVLGIPDRALNSALEWARKFPSTFPHPGAVVVWNHGHGHGHVGRIVGGGPGHWIVQSGNDGHTVRTRVRNISNAYKIVQVGA